MRLFWIADATYTEKPYAQYVASVDRFHRFKHVAGRAKHLQGHCYVFAAHLYKYGEGTGRQWASVLVGALLYIKGCSIPTLVGVLARHLRLPASVRQAWLTDSGILSRPLLRVLCAQEQFVLGQLRCNQRVYFPPRRRSPCQRRPRVFGQSCRVDQLLTRFPSACASTTRSFKYGVGSAPSWSPRPKSSCEGCGRAARCPSAW